MVKHNFSLTNNLDLIRLVAAIQVAIIHTARYLQYENSFVHFLSLLPGVPIFFFISGLLIYRSYDKCVQIPKGMRKFYWNRGLRLYPALIFCYFFTITLIWFSDYFITHEIPKTIFALWTVTSLTFFQFFNPEFLRDYGVGAVNGSLWTISVELQFYALTPFIFLLFQKSKKLILCVILLFVGFNIVNTYFNDEVKIYEKLFNRSSLPWLYMFLCGAAVAKWDFLIPIIQKIPYILIGLTYVLCWLLTPDLGLAWGNNIHPIGYIMLIILIIKFAFTMPNLSDRILKRNDISYGVYIYHMPIVNFLLYKNIIGIDGFLIALSSTIFLAIFSWFIIEKPCLKLKQIQLRRNKVENI